MNQLFISYAYVARQRERTYSGFGNAIVQEPPHQDMEEYLETLHSLADQVCKERNGFDAATTTILYWKEV